MQGPLVSVVMPIWRAEKFIGHTLASLGKQRHANWELLAVADNGDTGSSEILAAFAGANPGNRVSYEVLNYHGGAAEVRSVAARAAKGDLIAFLDSDDLWLPGFLEHAVEKISEKHQLVASPCFLIDEQNGFIGTYGPFPPEQERPDLSLFYRNLLAPTGLVMTKAAFSKGGEMPRRWKIVHDWALWHECRRLGYGIEFLAEPQVAYRKRTVSLTSKKFEVQTEGIRFLAGMLRSEDPAKLREANRAAFVFARQSWVVHWGVIRFLAAEILAYPWRFRLWFTLAVLFVWFCARMVMEKIRRTPNPFGPAYPEAAELRETLVPPASGKL